MNNNSIVFLTLSMICVYFVLDEFVGKKLIESAIYTVFPGLEPAKESTTESTSFVTTSNTNNGNFINLNPTTV